MATKWEKFATKQKQKRTKTEIKETCKLEELTVQRMSSQVKGKAQKYERIGGLEYVPVELVDDCDRNSLKRRQDKDNLQILNNKKSRAHIASPVMSRSLVNPKACSRQKIFPKSHSVLDIKRLGTVIKKSTSTVIEIHSFDIENMEWCSLPIEAEFIVEEKPFGSGGFREAFKATSPSIGFSKNTWVVKKYLCKAKNDMKELHLTVEQHARKAVQAHYLAKKLAERLAYKVEVEKLNYGSTFQYNKVFFWSTDKGEFVTVEEYVEGEFIKYVNNNGDICVHDSAEAEKAEAFVHYSYKKSHHKIMVLDIQGSGYNLYDPEFASSEMTDEGGELQFCTGNLTDVAIENFLTFHECNKYCKLLKIN